MVTKIHKLQSVVIRALLRTSVLVGSLSSNGIHVDTLLSSRGIGPLLHIHALIQDMQTIHVLIGALLRIHILVGALLCSCVVLVGTLLGIHVPTRRSHKGLEKALYSIQTLRRSTGFNKIFRATVGGSRSFVLVPAT